MTEPTLTTTGGEVVYVRLELPTIDTVSVPSIDFAPPTAPPPSPPHRASSCIRAPATR
jgi:hypothetical protein